MHKIPLKNSYSWYKMPENYRLSLWENNEFLVDHIDVSVDNIYLPVIHSNSWVNYCQPLGLLYFPKVFGPKYRSLYKNKKFVAWFGVRVFSPDDWDCDLDFSGLDTSNEELLEWQYSKLLEITKTYVRMGAVEIHDLFMVVSDEMLKATGLQGKLYG